MQWETAKGIAAERLSLTEMGLFHLHFYLDKDKHVQKASMAWLGLHMLVKENTDFHEIFSKGEATGITQPLFQRET